MEGTQVREAQGRLFVVKPKMALSFDHNQGALPGRWMYLWGSGSTL